MPIQYNPNKGQVLMCDFSEGFKEPEMVKERAVIVFKSSGRSKLVTVIPLSSVARNPKQNHHMVVPNMELPNTAWFKNRDSWLKGYMVYTVGWHRLSLVRMGKSTGRRNYYTGRLSLPMLKELDKCVLNGIGLGRLEKYT